MLKNFNLNNECTKNTGNGIEVDDNASHTVMYNTLKNNKISNSGGLTFRDNVKGYALGNTITCNTWEIFIGRSANQYIGENSVSDNSNNYNY